MWDRVEFSISHRTSPPSTWESWQTLARPGCYGKSARKTAESKREKSSIGLKWSNTKRGAGLGVAGDSGAMVI